MRYPKYLPKGGTIGFVAPSFGCNIEPYRSGFENARGSFVSWGIGLRSDRIAMREAESASAIRRRRAERS